LGGQPGDEALLASAHRRLSEARARGLHLPLSTEDIPGDKHGTKRSV